MNSISIDIIDPAGSDRRDRPGHGEAAAGLVTFYQGFNRRLDRMVVPHTINEARIVALRDQLHAKGAVGTAGYWLLMARLAEMASLCAAHCAMCGEIAAAGDLLINPRRIDVYLRGADNGVADRAVVKDRHRSLSDQFNPGGMSTAAFAAWFRGNAICRVVEPALLPDLVDRLGDSGWLSKTYLEALRARMAIVADAMRFGVAAGVSSAVISQGPQAGRHVSGGSGKPSLERVLDARDYHRLGRDVERTCRYSRYRSGYLTEHLRGEKEAGTTVHRRRFQHA